MAKHSAPPRPSGRPDRITALAGAMRALLKSPWSAAARHEVDAAAHGSTEQEYEAAWGMVRSEESAAAPPAPGTGQGKLTSGLVSLNWRAGAVAVLVAVIAAGLGTYAAGASYDTVSHLAALKHVALPRLNPIGIDGGLAGVIVLDIVATWLAEPIWWLRMSARVFAVATVAANAAAGWPDPVGVGLRIAAPVLFVVITEAGRTLLLRGKKAEERKRKAAAREQRRRDRIPAVRWLLDFKGTRAMWKRMRLWREPSYAKAVAMELERLAAIEKLAAEYGPHWQEKVPADLAWMLASGVRMTEALARAGELIAGEERGRALEAELRDLRASVTAQVAAARAGRDAEVTALRAELTRDLEAVRAELDDERRARAAEQAEAARALDRAVKAARAEARQPRARGRATRAQETVNAQDDDMANELRALMEFRDDPTLLGERQGGNLAEKLGVHPSTGRRLHKKMVENGQLKPEYAEMAAPLAGGGNARE